MHSALICGWSSAMTLFELIVIDPSDPVFNPIWRQGSYVLPFAARLGVNSSVYLWSFGATSFNSSSLWFFESVSLCHLFLSGLLALSAFWHWAYWDLDLFVQSSSGRIVLDLVKVFGIHLLLASIISFGFGGLHLSGVFGPGMWTSDYCGLLGSVRSVKPVYSILSLSPFSYGAIPANHIVTGVFGLVVSLWQISSRPGPLLFNIVLMTNLESVLSSSIATVLSISLISSVIFWYGSATSPIELFGPTRYQWDNGVFSLEAERRVKNNDINSWSQIPDKLLLYDYLGTNPSKGGLFRSGAQIKGDGVVDSWTGHFNFESKILALYVRRMPAFFETFPVILVDREGTVRGDIPFRRIEFRYSIEQVKISIYFIGGILDSSSIEKSSVVKAFARKSQFGKIFSFDKKVITSDGVFRTTSRGWYSFSHLNFSFYFLFGHLWHSGRAFFKSVWVGLLTSSSAVESIEYGRNEKLGDNTSKTNSFL